MKDWYLWDKPDRDLVLCYQDNIESLIKRQKRALVFVSGFSRKPCTCEEWIRAGWRVPYRMRIGENPVSSWS